MELGYSALTTTTCTCSTAVAVLGDYNVAVVEQVFVVPDWHLRVLRALRQHLQQLLHRHRPVQLLVEMQEGLVREVVVGRDAAQGSGLNAWGKYDENTLIVIIDDEKMTNYSLCLCKCQCTTHNI